MFPGFVKCKRGSRPFVSVKNGYSQDYFEKDHGAKCYKKNLRANFKFRNSFRGGHVIISRGCAGPLAYPHQKMDLRNCPSNPATCSATDTVYCYPVLPSINQFSDSFCFLLQLLCFSTTEVLGSIWSTVIQFARKRAPSLPLPEKKR